MKNRCQELTTRFAAILLFCAIVLGFTGCGNESDNPEFGIQVIQSFRDIPDITESEIAAIETLKRSRQRFSFGTVPSAEGFLLSDGTYAGFSPMLCELLSDLFGIPFVLEFHDSNSLAGGIDSKTIDFTSEYEITPERQSKYLMSDPVAQRSRGMAYDYNGTTDLSLVHGLLPLAYTPIALTTANNELEPVISVMNKYIAASGIKRLYALYQEGNNAYNRNVLYSSFSAEERAYIDSLSAKIPIVLGTDTYPVSFYNSNEDEFQGISIDVLTEISRMTGIEFEPINKKDATWGEILEMLRTGEAALISDLIITEERKLYFIWPQTPFFSTPYAFFSKTEYPNLALYQIGQAAVGVVGWCATRQLYDQWFPNNANVRLYDSQDDALDALERDEIDLFFNLGYILYYQQNYREKPGYKANYTFPVFNDTFFGLNINEKMLCSIIDKTIVYIDTGKIAKEWTSRSFDYSRILAEEQSLHANRRSLIVSVAAAILLLLMVIVVFLIDINNKTKKIAMEAEQEANEHFRIMLDSNPLCCKLWSSDYKILDCNQAAINLCGFKTKQEYLSSYFDLDPEFQPDGQRSDIKRIGYLKRVFEKGESLCFEWLHVLPDGSHIPVEITLARVKYGNDYVVAGYTRDLREQKRMFRELKESQATTSIILETNPQINVLFDSSFNVVDCNPAALRFMGFETKEAFFAGFFERFTGSLPEIQPDGRVSIPVSERLVTAAKKGYDKVETEVHIGDKTKNLLVEFVRIPYGNTFAIIAYAYDMTEMRNREKELIKAHETNKQYLLKVNLMLKATQIALWDMYVIKDDPVNPVNEIIYSDEFRHMLGYSNESDFPSIINSWSDKLHPEDKERSVNAFAAHMLDKTGNTPFDIEYRLLKKNGEYSYFHAYGETIRDKNGNPTHVAGSLIDVTEKVHELLNNERQLTLLNAVVKATKIGLYDVRITNNDFAHPDNTVTFTDEFRNMLGYKNEIDFPNTLENWENHLHPDDKDEAIAYVMRHVSDTTGETPYDAEYRLRKKDGEYAYFRACGEAIRDKDGNVIRIAGALLDITETKTTLLDKELQLTKLNLLIEAANIGIVNMEFDPNDLLGPNSHTEYSDKYKKLLGYTDDDDTFLKTLGESRIGLVHPDDLESSFRVFSAHLLDKTGNTPFDIEQRLKKKNGEYAWFRTVGKAIRDKDGNPIRFVNAAFDMTETKNLINEAEKQQMEAEIASRSKSNFLANMSHEMRTPLNAIIGMTVIGKKADDIVQKNHSLNKIGDASSHLLGVINDVLDMAKIEANKLELAPIEYNFERMLQKVLSVINFRVDEKQQRFSLNIDSNIPRFLIGDDQRLSQVITNLLANAVKFTPEGGEIHLGAFLVSETDGNCELRIEVKDSGIGISPEKHEKLFSAFEQADSGTSRQYGGTGLGLAISKHIVEFMDGTIWVESELGKGAAFIFTVKAQRSDKSPISMLAPGVNWKNVRILAVDDMAETRDQFQKLFGQLEMHCDVAADGHEACRIIEERGAYDIYFIDWRMPGMDGIELTKIIKESVTSKPSVVIMITAMDWEQIKEDALRAGVSKCLLKPLMSSMIIDCINETLGITDDIKEDNTVSDGEFGGKNLLVAEDVEINREILIALLEHTGLSIDCAENGEEALKMVQAAPDKYDIVFMDVQMPVMNGYEATRRIRALPARQRGRLPIIALTANVFKSDVEDCLAAGMDDHLGKPLDIDRVIEKLRAYLK
ncbi:MAG: PAS domain-containing protein [Treponema sp.]|nr:PAS domain-containing protein [Treponema sp.]